MKTRTRLAAVLLALLLFSAPISAETAADLGGQQPPNAETAAEITQTDEAEEVIPDEQVEIPIEEEPIVEGEPLTEEGPIVEEEALTEDEPIVEDEPLTEDEPIVEDEPLTEEEPLAEDEPIVEDEPIGEDELLTEEESLLPIDLMMAGLPPETPLCEVSFPAEVTDNEILLKFTLNTPGTLVITAESANGWQLISESGEAIRYTLNGLDDAYTESGSDRLTLDYSLPKHVILCGEFTDTISFCYNFTPAEG